MENPTVKKKPSSYFGEYSDLTNIYQRIKEAEYWRGFFTGLLGGAFGLMIYLPNCSDEVYKFFGLGWGCGVVILSLVVSALLGMAVQYLYNSYCNRESIKLPVPVVSDSIPTQTL